MWQTDMRAFVLDIATHIEEQVRSARDNPSDRNAALDAARGAIPFLRERLRGVDDGRVAQMNLLFEYWCGDHWEENWSKLTKHPADQFRIEADQMLGQIDILKVIFGASQK